jgi:hypothetical protein
VWAETFKWKTDTEILLRRFLDVGAVLPTGSEGDDEALDEGVLEARASLR